MYSLALWPHEMDDYSSYCTNEMHHLLRLYKSMCFPRGTLDIRMCHMALNMLSFFEGKTQKAQ